MEWDDDPRRLGSAEFRGLSASHPVEHIDVAQEPHRLVEGGLWVVVGSFEGRVDAWRFARAEHRVPASRPADPSRRWRGPDASAWRSSLDRAGYERGVDSIRRDIRDGDVYQVNLCRVLSAPLPSQSPGPDAVALSERLARGNPARYAARIVIPETEEMPGAWVVSASPESYLSVSGRTLTSAPIKGTAAPGVPMLDKDIAENVMITDLVRNDLAHVSEPGSISVPELLGEHAHPGLVHLQSTVSARLDDAHAWTPRMWGDLLDGTFPPGSVSGAPKSSALRIIAREETAPRGPYCGAIGWVDADARRAELAVGIRTFWWEPSGGGVLRFGTGAGITWGSDPAGEWEETELKARRLIGLASTDRMSP